MWSRFPEEMSKQSQECVKSDQPWQDVVASIFCRKWRRGQRMIDAFSLLEKEE